MFTAAWRLKPQLHPSRARTKLCGGVRLLLAFRWHQAAERVALATCYGTPLFACLQGLQLGDTHSRLVVSLFCSRALLYHYVQDFRG
jgi:hypothetical protein